MSFCHFLQKRSIPNEENTLSILGIRVSEEVDFDIQQILNIHQ